MKQWDAKLSRKFVHTAITVAVTLLVFGGGTFAYLFFKSDTQTTLTDNPGRQLTSTVKATNAADAHFTEADFSFNLPADWKKVSDPSTNGTHGKYSYRATQKNADNRYLDIYMDEIPATMAVDREVAVHADSNKLTHGEVSNNCPDFTNRTSPDVHVGPGKWDGVDFMCDIDNKAGDVIGTSAPGSINKVELEGSGTGKHDFFFVYTDDNYNPDYGIFYNFLDSFALK